MSNVLLSACNSSKEEIVKNSITGYNTYSSCEELIPEFYDEAQFNEAVEYFSKMDDKTFLLESKKNKLPTTLREIFYQMTEEQYTLSTLDSIDNKDSTYITYGGILKKFPKSFILVKNLGLY